MGDQRSRVVVQERIPFPRKANGYHSLVPTVDVVMNLQDKMNELNKALAHQLLIEKGDIIPC